MKIKMLTKGNQSILIKLKNNGNKQHDTKARVRQTENKINKEKGQNQ